MPIERWADHIVVVHLADDPQLMEDLATLDQMVEQGRLDAVIDFSAVHYVNSSHIARLLRVRRGILEKDGKLVLCGIQTQVWGTFLVTGLDKIFTCSDNVTTGLATVQLAK
jgi:anti-anti-sigma factor